MVRIMFVCLGNICRSPMAEFVMKDLVIKNHLENSFRISSSATSYEEIGNDVHYGTVDKLNEVGIPVQRRKAVRLKKEDYKKYDYIIGMEESNVRNILKIVGDDNEGKVCKLLDFTEKPRDIADPWFTGNFTNTYNDILEGCTAFLNKIKE